MPATTPPKLNAVLDQLGIPASQVDAIVSLGLHFMGEAFGHVFLVATVWWACA